MTTMNNEDPADPSVHEPRVTGSPAAWLYVEDPFGANEHHWMLDSPESQGCDPREWTPLYTADQMRAAIAAEREAVAAGRERAERVSQATAQRVPARSETGPFAYTGAQLLASQPANDELPEPVARIASLTNHQGGKWYALEPLVSNPLTINTKVYTADQMREAIAAEREQQTKPPKWWTCQTHGDAQPNAWGCPECVREMRSELDALREAIEEAAAERERSHELLQAADHIRAGLEAKLAALSAALAEKEQPQ